jgi:hypothetical protein
LFVANFPRYSTLDYPMHLQQIEGVNRGHTLKCSADFRGLRRGLKTGRTAFSHSSSNYLHSSSSAPLGCFCAFAFAFEPVRFQSEKIMSSSAVASVWGTMSCCMRHARTVNAFKSRLVGLRSARQRTGAHCHALAAATTSVRPLHL